MDENTKLWNKKMDELTVGDIVKVNVAAPIIMVGAGAAALMLASAAEKATSKFREFKMTRRNKNTEE